jgi:FKBP-type peptidyl-prolyl cis-trans isomerase SlyD
MQIANQNVASFHYTLTNDGDDVLDTSEHRGPLAYLHGAGNIVPGLAQVMAGRKVGNRFKVDVAPAQGCGPRRDELVRTLPTSAFKGVETPRQGVQFKGEGPQGQALVTVTAVEGDQVTIDGNHPLAGENLHFAVEVTDVRPATAEELTQGRVVDTEAPAH